MIETHERLETVDDVLFQGFLMRVNTECGQGTRKYLPLELARKAFDEGRKLSSYDEAVGAFREGCLLGVVGSFIVAGSLAALYVSIRRFLG